MTTWRKSRRSVSDGHCVEVAYRKSSRSASGNCVEVASGSVILVRDSKAGEDSPVLPVSPSAWRAFTRQIKNAATG